nr:immunoglobulin heavy chain junction region [Macaca mulatta]MOW50908.1 immunoglobulin heavy chain junction region [Macaca mulatta]
CARMGLGRLFLYGLDPW